MQRLELLTKLRLAHLRKIVVTIGKKLLGTDSPKRSTPLAST